MSEIILPVLRPKEAVEIQQPRMYRVLYLNDDYTPFIFVIRSLRQHFQKAFIEAYDIADSVHKTGVGCAGIYTFEIAETKAIIAQDEAKDAGYPLQITIEADDRD